MTTKFAKVVKPEVNGSGPSVTLEIPPISLGRLTVRLVGDSPLIVHAWSDKAKKMMLDKQTKQAKQAKAAKDPVQEFLDSLYWLTDKPERRTDPMAEFDPTIFVDARFGFPCIGFKASAVGACRYADMKMTEARGAFHIDGEMVEILGSSPTMREDMCRIGMGVADIRYRAQFHPWYADLNVVFNERAISAGQIVNLFNLAGFGVGLGEWRPERDGQYGRFHVAKEGEFA